MRLGQYVGLSCAFLMSRRQSFSAPFVAAFKRMLCRRRCWCCVNVAMIGDSRPLPFGIPMEAWISFPFNFSSSL